MRFKTAAAVAVLALAVSVFAPSPGVAAPKPKPPTPVGTDDAGDWGCNHNCALAPLGTELGQDLTQASLGMADKKTLTFVIGVDSLPGPGGVPEASRYTWEFMVDGTAIQMSGAFTEYARGICNPVYNPMICPPPRDPGQAPFFFRVGGCLVGGPCEEIAIANGKFDAAAGTITVPVPLADLGAKPGSKIEPGISSSYGATVIASPAAFISSPNSPYDTMMVTDTYVVPKKKKK